MTTGRINQVAFTYPRQMARNRSNSSSLSDLSAPEPRSQRRLARQAIRQMLNPVTNLDDHHHMAAINIILSPQRSVLLTAQAKSKESVSCSPSPCPECQNVSYNTGQAEYKRMYTFRPGFRHLYWTLCLRTAYQ